MKSSSSIILTLLLTIGYFHCTKAFHKRPINNIFQQDNQHQHQIKHGKNIFESVAKKNAMQIRGGDAAPDKFSGWVKTAGVLAPIVSVLLSISPLPTILTIIKNKSVGQLPLLPYSSLVANCFIWFCYGILKQEAKVWSCNGFSVAIGLYYFASFSKFSPAKSQTLPGSLLQHINVIAFTIIASLAVAASMPRTKAASILGSAAVGVCIALYASPLAALKTVYRSKSAESIPLPFAIVTTLNCILWLIVGIFDMNDIKIWFPCVPGLGCGLLQIALKLIYGDGKMQTA